MLLMDVSKPTGSMDAVPDLSQRSVCDLEKVKAISGLPSEPFDDVYGHRECGPSKLRRQFEPFDRRELLRQAMHRQE
jgi:hypothetical protein